MFRSTWRHTQPFCKVDFTKIRFFAFFLITIRYISQKSSIFAPCFKRHNKTIFKTNKNYAIMKLVIIFKNGNHGMFEYTTFDALMKSLNMYKDYLKNWDDIAQINILLNEQ